MKFLDKVALFIFSTIILILSISLMLIGFKVIDPNVFGVLLVKLSTNQVAIYVMIGMCILLSLLALRCLFFVDYDKMKKTETGILMQNDDGKLLITRNTLENIVESIIKEFPNIDSSEVDVLIDKENEILIDIILNAKEGVIIKDLSLNLQSKIKDTIKQSTDLDVKTIDISVKQVEIKNVKIEENN